MKKISYDIFFKALSNRTRLGIIQALRAGPKNVTRLRDELGLEQSRVSHGLSILSSWGLVTSKREGKNIVYSLDKKHLLPALEHLDGYLAKHERSLCTCGILKGKSTCSHLKRN
jgi:DNA-binding transcriptional ArsR family regulator